MWFERALALLGWYPFRCEACRARFFVWSRK
jgi:hypothetical protein